MGRCVGDTILTHTHTDLQPTQVLEVVEMNENNCHHV